MRKTKLVKTVGTDWEWPKMSEKTFASLVHHLQKPLLGWLHFAIYFLLVDPCLTLLFIFCLVLILTWLTVCRLFSDSFTFSISCENGDCGFYIDIFYCNNVKMFPSMYVLAIFHRYFRYLIVIIKLEIFLINLAVFLIHNLFTMCLI